MIFIEPLISIFIFILGVCIGSFLNCVIYRIEQNKKISGRSFCPHCKHQLAWQDLIPVFSFILLRGKCRQCKKEISMQYPLVELATGLIFILIFNFKFLISNQAQILNTLDIALLFYFASALIVIFVYDFKHYIIPDKILFPAIIIALMYRVLDFRNLDLFRNWNLGFWVSSPSVNYFFAALIGSMFFLVIFLVSQGLAMGFGDVKLAILMGFLLGFPNILVALFLAFFFGAIIGLMLMASHKKNLKSEMPFGPFLIVGNFMALFWGNQMVNWYMGLFV